MRRYWVWHGDEDRNPVSYLCDAPTNALDDSHFTAVYKAADVQAWLEAWKRKFQPVKERQLIYLIDELLADLARDGKE